MMDEDSNSILVIGFNTRPLVYSLNQAGYEVYAVDFFGDLDLYPHAKDTIIVTEELGSSYQLLRDDYNQYILNFAKNLLKNYLHINKFIISSGLDDYYEERKKFSLEVQNINPKIKSLNNQPKVIKKARNTFQIQKILDIWGYSYPSTISYSGIDNSNKYNFPFILKKRNSSGGLNVYKIESIKDLKITDNLIRIRNPDLVDWQVQEFIDGIPVSCTTISDGETSALISVNRQVIGERLCNSPREFMYCGNIVPGNLLKIDEQKITEIALKLCDHLKLRGINGFDFIIKNHEPYFMEINPRIPGSIRASESSLGINLLDLHVKSFNHDCWSYIERKLNDAKLTGYTTKLIFFAPIEISSQKIKRINKMAFIHDKSKPDKNLRKYDPVCSVLYKAPNFADSYSNALKIVGKINDLLL